MTRGQAIWYYSVHVLLVGVALALTTTSAVVDFRPEFRVGVGLSAVLLGIGMVTEGLYEFASQRARKGAVWILYTYFTAPLVLVAVNIVDRAGSGPPGARDRFARNAEAILFAGLVVAASLARLLFLTYSGFSDFLSYDVGAALPRRLEGRALFGARPAAR